MRTSRNRPEFIGVSLIVLISLLLGACAQPAPAPAPAAPAAPAATAPAATGALNQPKPEPTKAPAAAPATTKAPEPTKAAAAAPAAAKQMIFASAAMPTSLNIFNMPGGQWMRYFRFAFGRLTNLDVNNKIVPDLAEKLDHQPGRPDLHVQTP